MYGAIIDIEKQQRTAYGTAQIARFKLRETFEYSIPEQDLYRLDMALTARPPSAKGQYGRHRQSRYRQLGHVWMSLPDEPMRFYSEAGDTHCVQCSVNSDAVSHWTGRDLSWAESALETTLDLSGSRFHRLLSDLAEELNAPGFAAEAMVELIVGQIAIEIGRYWHHAVADASARGLALWQLRAIEERLGQEGRAPTLQELATLCKMSVRQLTRGFRASKGQSIGEAIAMQRIALAKQLLASDHSAKTVAYRLGFTSPAGFGYAFRKGTGETPRMFRMRRALQRNEP